MLNSRGRALIALLLVVTAALFAIGTAIERSDRHSEEGSATPAAASNEGGEADEGDEAGEEGEASHEGAETPHSASSEESETVLGIDTESTPVIVAGVAASALLAVAVLLVRSRAVLVVVAGFTLLFAAGDLRELLHQLDESRTSVAVIAAILLVLHLATCALAAQRFRREGETAKPAAT